MRRNRLVSLYKYIRLLSPYTTGRSLRRSVVELGCRNNNNFVRGVTYHGELLCKHSVKDFRSVWQYRSMCISLHVGVCN